MASFDDEPRKISRTHEIGQQLSMLSVDELRERISQLKAEVTRLESELDAKGGAKAAADAFFKI